jgi:hypothetical protein
MTGRPYVPAADARQAGFTLVELLSVLAATVMFSGLILYFAFNYWSSMATLESDMETYVSRLDAGDILRDAINSSSGLVVQNTHRPDPTIMSGDFWEPIHAVPGVIANTAGTHTPVTYFRAPSIDTSKNIIMNGTQPYEDEFVLYMDGTTREMRLRTLANGSAPGNVKLTSCPDSVKSASCPGDKRVAANVESVEMRYFSRSGNPINYQSITDPVTGEFIGPDFQVVEVIEYKLKLSKKSRLKGGTDTVNETVIRVALRSS